MNTNCPCCSSTSFKPYFFIKSFSYLKCNKCGFLFLLNPDVSKNQYDNKYFSNNIKSSYSGYMSYLDSEKSLRRNFKKYIRIAQKHVDFKEAEVLDIGCAYGFLLDEIRKKGSRVTGIDYSEGPVDWMKKNLHINGYNGSISNLKKKKYDVVIISETIEHISDIKVFMSSVFEILKPGGIFIIITGDCDSIVARLLGKYWWYLNPPDHCSIYSSRALNFLVTNNGMRVLTHKIFPYHWVNFDNFLLKIARVFNNRFIAKISERIFSFSFPVFHFTTQFLVAKKNN